MKLNNEELMRFTKNYSNGNDAELIVYMRDDGKKVLLKH